MERRPNQYTIKISFKALELLRQIAAQTGELQYRVIQRLLTKEWEGLQRDATRKES